ncbi:MAG: RNA methyltransferase [Oligoflexia bacterium]|nr:RNA methyltransferase [Oligoflexia bacterium]
MNPVDLSVVLLHDKMVDKTGSPITSSVTLIDIHDLARSSSTYGARNVFISHPSATMRRLARTLQHHWEGEFGSSYNPNRKEALAIVEVVSDLDEAIQKIDLRTGKLPTLIATSARGGERRVSFKQTRERLRDGKPYLLMLGTGWGMSRELLDRADLILEPIQGPTQYNHLSVRSACAIMLDRLLAPRTTEEH